MTYSSPFYPRKSLRVLVLSQRKHKLHVSQCFIYEFEDTICDLGTVDLATPTFTRSLAKRITNRLAQHMFEATGRGQFLNPISNEFSTDEEYDLFFVYCQNPLDIFYLNSIKDWRKKCRKAVCYLEEIWLKDVEKWRVQLRLLKDFDHIFINSSSSVDAVANVVQRPCHFLPIGIDAAKFCPYPLQPRRAIDVYSMGRRSSITHEALIDLAARGNFFYIYDTVLDTFIPSYKYHRSLLSNLVKRSRYFIAYRAKFENSETTGAQEELGARFFEGAAGGAVMLGTPPDCEAYRTHFDWPDAVIPVPYKAANIADVLAELDAQPERLARIHIDNVVNSLLRHDWVYRWGKILEAVGLERTPEMVSREDYLQNLAKMVGATSTQNCNQL